MTKQDKNYYYKKSTSMYTLEGTTNLHCIRKTLYYKDMELVDQKVTERYFPLREVSVEELFKLRLSRKPGFVLKINGSYYYTQILKNMKLLSSNLLGKHLCSLVGFECDHLSAASDKNGGCAKVRDSTVLSGKTGTDFIETLKSYDRIEKYDFITKGFETFNTNQEALFVIECKNYENQGKNKKKNK